MNIYETDLTHAVLEKLIFLSEKWEKENSCYGYRANKKEDIDGNRIFLAEENGEIIGYLFGKTDVKANMSSVFPDDVPFFEIAEIYVVPEKRSKGVGRALFDFAAEKVKSEADYIILSTATKNQKAILHFYIDEVGMSFHSARLFKKIR